MKKKVRFIIGKEAFGRRFHWSRWLGLFWGVFLSPTLYPRFYSYSCSTWIYGLYNVSIVLYLYWLCEIFYEEYTKRNTINLGVIILFFLFLSLHICGVVSVSVEVVKQII